MNNRILYIPKEKKYIQKRSSSRRVWIFGGLIFFVAMIAASVAMVRLSALQIQTISVSGLNSIHSEDVQREVASVLIGSYAAGLIPYRFLLAVPAQTIADAVKHRFPLIAEASIEKKFPNELAIIVKERTMFGILCNDASDIQSVPGEDSEIQCSYLDTEGIAYAQAPQSQGFLIMKILTDAPSVAIGDRVIDPAMMRRIMDIDSKLPKVINSPIVGYQLLQHVPREVRAMSKQGFSLIINRDDDLDHALHVLASVIEKEIGSKRKNLDYIDLRFGNKVFYKFK